jgi:DNA-binding NtrC family response regulator
MKPDAPIMMVDDEEEVLRAQTFTLNSVGFDNIITVTDSHLVFDILREKEVELILLDLMMPALSGEEVLTKVKQDYPHIPVIVITAKNAVDTAVNCMKSGALDYMVKPVEKNRLISGIQNAVEIRNWKRRYADLKSHLIEDKLDHPEVFQPIVTRDRRMRGIFQYIETIGKTDLPIFISGETGTGKELIARAIHTISGCEGEFVPVNIAGLDDTMFSDTLFGHRKGSYTGATEDRKGLIRQAAKGTLFIDEIGDLQPRSQVKLLRLLDYREYYPLGSDVKRASDARIVLATQKPHQELLQSPDFRNDLYYRIAIHNIVLPPLRERKGDIPLLLHHFLHQACEEFSHQVPIIPNELYTLLNCYHFPGNVRELRSMVWDAVSRQESHILSMGPFRKSINLSNASLPAEHTNNMVTFGDRLPTIKQVTDVLIEEAVARAQGNLSVAAQYLGISHQALSKRLKRRDE